MTMNGDIDLNKPDLWGWKHRVRTHWTKHCPKLVAALKREGEGVLEEHIEEAARSGEGMYNQLLRQGVSDDQAHELADHEYILLPDIDTNLNPQPDETTE